MQRLRRPRGVISPFARAVQAIRTGRRDPKVASTRPSDCVHSSAFARRSVAGPDARCNTRPSSSNSMDLYANEDAKFTKWVTASGFLHESFVLVDVGVQGGEHRHWHLLGDHLVVHGFDALEEAVAQL